MVLYPEPVVSLFIQEGETQLLTMSAYAIRIYGLTFLTRWFGFAVQSFMVALEVPLPAVILSVSNALVIPIVLLPILWSFKLDGIWMNTPITALLVSIMALYFYVKFRKNSFQL